MVNFGCLSLIYNPPASFLHSPSSIHHHTTFIPLGPSSIFHLELFFSGLRCGIFNLKCPQHSGILDKMSASAACTACNFFQVSNCHGWSPTILRMVTHQKEVYFRHGIWHLHITQTNKTRQIQTWKKLQAVQAALADILSVITLF